MPALLLMTFLSPLWWFTSWQFAVPVCVLFFYLAPPLLARAIQLAGQPEGTCTFASRAGRIWYALHLLQVIFLRFPALEEPLRLIPGLYQSWLCLWGSQVSLFSVWGPGAVAVDRHALRVGAGAIIGGRAWISGHTLANAPDGGVTLVCAPVEIGPGATIGGMAMIGPGCVIEAQELVPASDRLPPFSIFSGGRRRKGAASSGAAAASEKQAE